MNRHRNLRANVNHSGVHSSSKNIHLPGFVNAHGLCGCVGYHLVHALQRGLPLMKINVASEADFGNIARQLGKLDPFHKGYYGFVPSDTWTPNVNLYESETCYLVCVDLAGVEKSQIEVTVHNARLKLTGRREAPTTDAASPDDAARPRLRVHLMEIDHGNFSREVELPADVDQTRITASFNNGLLWIELPKT